jgi:hypothetical protein
MGWEKINGGPTQEGLKMKKKKEHDQRKGRIQMMIGLFWYLGKVWVGSHALNIITRLYVQNIKKTKMNDLDFRSVTN